MKESYIVKETGDLKSYIETSLQWSDDYHKDTFPRKKFKEYRRLAKKIEYSLQDRCSVAAYGESQVGKSYLMSSLLSSSNAQFVVKNKDREYSFVNEINPSGRNSTEIESTGLITRFTTADKNKKMADYIRIQNLSVPDLLMLIVDSYYSDVKINAKQSLSPNSINDNLHSLQELWKSKYQKQDIIGEDDIRDIQEYMVEVIGVGASSVLNSDFFDVVADNIKYVSMDHWVDVFELLWNKNEHFCKIFTTLIKEYQKIGFRTEVYVPFDAILREKGTLLQVQWLDLVCGKEVQDIDFPVLNTDIYDENEKLIASDFPKTYLSAFAAEVVIVLPGDVLKERPFLAHVDLLDFPGARNRLDKIEDDIDYKNDMPEMLRRGKVAYLFNKYVRTRRISSIMFCHHHSQKKANLGNTIKDWIEKTVGLTPKIRTKNLKILDNISPLFVIATKFNKDLSKRGTESAGKLANHWERFTKVLPEIIGSSQWFEQWQERDNKFVPFQSIYPLRDFYWSGIGPERSALFEGYSDGSQTPKSGETKLHEQEGYPNYFQDLHDSFINLPFVQRHFADPEQTWKDVMEINKDGSEPIINDIDRISTHLSELRVLMYLEELRTIKKEIQDTLNGYYEPDSDEDKLKRTQLVMNRVRARMLLNMASDPQVFGKILDCLMISPREIRKIAKDIIVLKKDIPKDIPGINLIRFTVGITPDDNKEVRLQKLLAYNAMSTKEELDEEYADKDYSVDDIISGEEEFCATVSDVLTKHIIEFWIDYLNSSISALGKYLPFTEEIVLMYQTLLQKLGVKKRISENIARYDKMFETKERLNAIADYASLELNNFISTVGRRYMSEENLKEISEKALRCNVNLDLTAQGIEATRKKQPVVDALNALDESFDIMRKPGFNESDMQTLRRLPLWDNFQRWQNLLLIGLLLASGVSTKDPAENQAVKELIEKINLLYS